MLDQSVRTILLTVLRNWDHYEIGSLAVALTNEWVMYNVYNMSSYREKYKSEYEMRLRDELDVITTKTNSELEKIKNNTKEMYERENRWEKCNVHDRKFISVLLFSKSD